MVRRGVFLSLLILMVTSFPITASFATSNSTSSDPITTISISPSKIVGPPPGVGQTFAVNVTVQNVTKLFDYDISVSWNPAVLNYSGTVTYFTTFFKGTFGQGLELYSPGLIAGIASSYTGTSSGATGSGPLAEIEFQVLNYGFTWINISVNAFLDPQGNIIPYSAVNGSFNLPPPHGPKANFTYSPLTLHANDLVTFNASASSPGFNGTALIPIISYKWDFGDANVTTVSVPIIRHAYKSSGTYTVNLTVTCTYDSVLASLGFLSNSTRQSIGVLPPPPHGPTAIETYTPSYPFVNQTVTFNASASLQGWNKTASVPIANYTWNFGDLNITTTTNPIITHVYKLAGTYTVNLTVTCKYDAVLAGLGLLSNSTWQEITIKPLIIKPAASFTYSPLSPTVGEAVTFNASASTPGGGVILSYEWNFGDGNITLISVPVVLHTYVSKGVYTVVLNVTNSQGLWNATSKTITVSARAVPRHPLISPVEGQWANYTECCFQNGSITGFGQRDFIYERYVSPYMINISMWINFSWGINGTVWMVVNTLNRTVESTGPGASEWLGQWYPYWIETNVTLGSTVNLRGGQATVVASQIIKIGEYSINCWELYLYTKQYQYRYWYDKLSGLMIASEYTGVSGDIVNTTLVATNIPIGVPPVASFTYSPGSPVVGETVTFNASASYDPYGTLANYTWNFGDGTPVVTVTEPVITHVFTAATSYNVTLTVEDTRGLWSATSKTITVTSTGPQAALGVEVDVGSIYFRGELAEFYVLVSYLGKRVNATNIEATLYYANGTLNVDLSASVKQITTGLYRIPYTLPSTAPAGTYVLVVDVSLGTLQGTSMGNFLLSPTLTGCNAWLIEINSGIATIKTDFGIIEVSLQGINATLKSINGTTATIQSSIGEIQVSLSQINAKLAALNGTEATIQTDIGTINASIYEIQLKVTQVQGDIATITTSLGDINGTIVSIQGDIATIKTDIGEIQASLPPTKTTVGISIEALFLAIATAAAIAAVIAVALLLRKQKKGTY